MTQRHSKLKRFSVSNAWERVAQRFFVVLGSWLKRRSRRRFEQTLSRAGFSTYSSEAYGVGESLTIQPEPFKRTRLESIIQQGFPGDTSQQIAPAGPIPNWAEEIQPFLKNQLSDHTRRAYETDLKQFIRFLEGKVSPGDFLNLRPEMIIEFRKALEEGRFTGRPMEKSTINRKLAVVKSYFNWLRANSLVQNNPAELVKGFPQTQESNLKGLSDEEARRILDKPNRNSKSGAMHAAVLHVLLHLGLRKGELIGLKVGDLDEERGVRVIKVRGKGHRVRILPITERVLLELKNYFFVTRRSWEDKESPMFLPTKNPRTGNLMKTLNPNAISYIVVRYARKCGILKPISPHSCRATCISHALDKRATHRSVQHLAGWSTPLMIQRYDKRREDLKNSAAFLIDYETEVPATAPAPS